MSKTSRFALGLSPSQRDELASIAKKLTAPGKGILAADESNPTLEKRFKEINVQPTGQPAESHNSEHINL